MAHAHFRGGQPEDFWSRELPTWEAVALAEEMLWGIDVLVVEAFVPRPGVRTWQPDAIESIGALRYLASKEQNTELVIRKKPDKRFLKKLERIGWRNPTTGNHADDASVLLLVEALVRGVLDPALVE